MHWTIRGSDAIISLRCCIESNRAITVSSVNGAASTIIDGDTDGDGTGDGSVVTFDSGEGSGSVLDGFTITNGNAPNGGGIFCWTSSPSLTNCTISGNSAESYGGGISFYSSSPTITNCTISGNSATYGGGISCSSSSSPMVVNSILWGNAASGSPNEIYLDGTGSIDIMYSDIQGGWSGRRNINSNPNFVNPRPASEAPTSAGDYHLQSYSPCIDTGDDNEGDYPDLPADDIDGDTRPIGVGYDMGSDEVVCPDADGDNYYGVQGCDTEVDCNDHYAGTYPGATEICDAQDNDCDGDKDEGGVCSGFLVSPQSASQSIAFDGTNFLVSIMERDPGPGGARQAAQLVSPSGTLVGSQVTGDGSGGPHRLLSMEPTT